LIAKNIHKRVSGAEYMQIAYDILVELKRFAAYEALIHKTSSLPV
jgi:hypothetical protein